MFAEAGIFGPLIPWLFTVIVGLGTVVVTYLFAKKAGLQPVQRELLKTLQDTVKAQNDRIDGLEALLTEERGKRESLERQVEAFQQLVTTLSTENTNLRAKIGRPPRAKDVIPS